MAKKQKVVHRYQVACYRYDVRIKADKFTDRASAKVYALAWVHADGMRNAAWICPLI